MKLVVDRIRQTNFDPFKSPCNTCGARVWNGKEYVCNPEHFSLRSSGDHFRSIPQSCPDGITSDNLGNRKIVSTSTEDPYILYRKQLETKAKLKEY